MLCLLSNMNDFATIYKKAITFLHESNPTSSNKPLIPHVLCVAEDLHNRGFSKDVVEAAILHDTVEWSNVSTEKIEELFGTRVAELVSANTKDRSIQNSIDRRIAQINKCLEIGDDALAIKIADNIDSFHWYTTTQNEAELERCRNWAELLLKYISDELRTEFGEKLEHIKTSA